MINRVQQGNPYVVIVVVLTGGIIFSSFINTPPPRLIILGGMGFLLALIGFLKWKTAVFGVLFLIVFEGALRKWVFPGYHEFIYLAKDILLFGAYLRFYGGKIIRHEKLIPRHPINPLIGFFLVWGGVSALNPNLPNYLVGLFGFKAYFYYIPLFYMVPYLFKTKQELNEFFFVMIIFSIPVCVLGIIQYFSPLNSPLVTYLGWGEEARVNLVSTVGKYPRVSGTFSYITGYVTYLFTIVLIISVLLASVGTLGSLRKGVLFFCFTLILINLLMTGSRWAIYMLGVLIPFFFYMIYRVSRQLALKMIPGIIAGFFIFGFIGLTFVPEAGNAFFERATKTNRDIKGRISNIVVRPIKSIQYSYGWGLGLGSTHQATAFLVKNQPLYSWLPTREFEGESGRVMLEIGLIGFTLFYLLKIGFIYHLFQLRKILKDHETNMIAVFVFLFHLSFFANSTIFNVTASFYFWFFSGFIFLLPKLDHQGKMG